MHVLYFQYHSDLSAFCYVVVVAAVIGVTGVVALQVLHNTS
jgi:hypothetical protein